jgi:D-alanyl-D-alanine carboxypeptidase/D-alanyl-D-alanine-endopeptidase (penicillin-binding protein 4)
MAREFKARESNESRKYCSILLFASAERRVGQRAYETGASALAFNFNSIGFEVCPSVVGRDALISVNPWEVPVSLVGTIKTSLSRSSFSINEVPGSTSPFGAYRASGAIGIDEACQVFFRSVRDPIAYFGATFKGLINEVGIELKSPIGQGGVSSMAPLTAYEFYTQESKPLNQIIEDLNHFSNNFIAEQLLYAIGSNGKAPLDRARGLAQMAGFLKAIGISDREFSLDDASGLSHENHITPSAIAHVLVYAQNNPQFQSEFETSLSIAGKTGTLKTRPLDGVLVRGKNWHTDGVSSLADYPIYFRWSKACFCHINKQYFIKG